MALKERLTTAPSLVYPNFFVLLALYTDASGDSVGFDLTQIEHGRECAIAYGGRNF